MPKSHEQRVQTYEVNSAIPSFSVGDQDGRHLRAQRTYYNAIEVFVSTGSTAMVYRLEPKAMRALADFLSQTAGLIDADPDPRARV